MYLEEDVVCLSYGYDLPVHYHGKLSDDVVHPWGPSICK